MEVDTVKVLSGEMAPGGRKAVTDRDGDEVIQKTMEGEFEMIDTPEVAYLLEEQARKLKNAEILIERLKREVMVLSFSVELHDRAAEKAIALWAEAHPDEAEEWLRREDLMVWMIERVERAEAVKESLTSALLKISGFSAFWKGFRGNEGAWENVWDLATDALISIRTLEKWDKAKE